MRGVLTLAGQSQGYRDRLQESEFSKVFDVISFDDRPDAQALKLLHREATVVKEHHAYIDGQIEVSRVPHMAVGVEMLPADMEGANKRFRHSSSRGQTESLLAGRDRLWWLAAYLIYYVATAAVPRRQTTTIQHTPSPSCVFSATMAPVPSSCLWTSRVEGPGHT